MTKDIAKSIKANVDFGTISYIESLALRTKLNSRVGETLEFYDY